MTEAFLHYIWQFQYFDKTDLQTTTGEQVSVFQPGLRNAHAGPDFFNAKIRIADMNWIGNVEIHIRSSAWYEHHHDEDDAYENVILHVVWQEDRKITRKDHSELPTVELKSRVAESLLLQYRKLVNAPGLIPCSAHFENVSSIIKFSMLDKALMQRLEARAAHVKAMLLRNKNDWEETAYQLLCRNFGFKVNADPFEQLAASLPYRVIMRHADKLIQVEALLFGQAGFLEQQRDEDDYYALLRREYQLLRAKYNLSAGQLNEAQWRFLRLRPANFPSLRIAQLASVLFSQKHIFSRMVHAVSYKELRGIFSGRPSGYWQHHYQFFKPIQEQVPALGSMSIDNIIINTVVPLLVSYGRVRDEQEYVDHAVEILQHTAPEENAIARTWKGLNLVSRSAADSQAMLELHDHYCLKRRCLDCTIGFSILKPAAP